MSPLLKKKIFFTFFALAQLSLLAQEVPPPPQRTVPVGLPMPINGNIMLLLAAGLILGVYVVYRGKKSLSSQK